MAVSSNTRSKRRGPLLSLQPPPPRRRVPRPPPQPLNNSLFNRNTNAPAWYQEAANIAWGNKYRGFVFPTEDPETRRERSKRDRRRRQRLANRGRGAAARSRKWKNGRAGARVALCGRGKDGRFLVERRDLTPVEEEEDEDEDEDEEEEEEEEEEEDEEEREVEIKEEDVEVKEEIEVKDEEMSEFGGFDEDICNA